MSLREIPFAVAVTATEYVPAGVALFVGLDGGVPPDPPPDPAQAAIPKEARARKSRGIQVRRLRQNANLNPKRTQMIGGIREERSRLVSADCAEDEERPVAICRVTEPVAPAATVSLGGLKVQVEFAGSEPHAKVKVPLEPLPGMRAMEYVAVCPLATVWVDWPDEDSEKSNPVPESVTCALDARVGLEMVILPVCCPAAMGAKAICAVQEAAGARVEPQVVEAI